MIDDVVQRVAAETGFSGVVRIDDEDDVREYAFGLADRRAGTPNTASTRFALASGAKGFTALTVMRLVEAGRLDLDLPVRRILGRDLPEIDDRVTIEHLLAHRSGIGDYLDESASDDINAYAMPVSVHRLAATEHYLPALDGHRQVFDPDERFAYNNSGYVVLALVAERTARAPFEVLVDELVCRPAGLGRTGYLRTDELPGDVALGYLAGDGLRTNVLHLPVMGSGDGGIFSTTADVRRFWSRLFEGAIVGRQTLAQMIRPRSTVPEQRARYGLGFWLCAAGSAVWLEGYDAGVSFRSVHDPVAGITHTVISNTSEGAWPVTKALDAVLGLG